MKSRRAGSAQWMSSNTMTHGPCSASRSKNSRHALNRSSRSRTEVSTRPMRCARRGSIHLRSSGSGTYCSTALWSLSSAEEGSSPSVMRARILTISASAQYVTPSP